MASQGTTSGTVTCQVADVTCLLTTGTLPAGTGGTGGHSDSRSVTGSGIGGNGGQSESRTVTGTARWSLCTLCCILLCDCNA